MPTLIEAADQLQNLRALARILFDAHDNCVGAHALGQSLRVQGVPMVSDRGQCHFSGTTEGAQISRHPRFGAILDKALDADGRLQTYQTTQHHGRGQVVLPRSVQQGMGDLDDDWIPGVTADV